MGSGHLSLRKIYKRETMWKEKNSNRHKCNFDENCILRVISLNNEISYYNVMKCNQCLSFTSVREPGNIQGCIFKELTEKQKSLPIITAYYKHKYIIMNFADLENVSYSNKV